MDPIRRQLARAILAGVSGSALASEALSQISLGPGISLQGSTSGGGGGGGGGTSNVFLNLKTDFHAIGDGSANDGGAWTQALASGFNIYVPPGTYALYGAVNTASSNTILQGVPGASILLMNTPGPVSASNPSFRHPGIFCHNATDVTIDSLTFQQINPSVREHGVLCYVSPDPNDITQRMAGAETARIRVINCSFIGMNAVSMNRWSEEIWIDRCRMDGQGLLTPPGSGTIGAQGGIGTGGDLFQSQQNQDGTVRNIFITNNYIYHYREEAIDINWDTENAFIVNNILEDCNLNMIATNEYIDIGGGGTGHNCRKIFVLGNAVYNNISANTNPTGVHYKTGTANTGIINDIGSPDGIVADNYLYSTATSATNCGVIIGDTNNTIVANNHIVGWNHGIQVNGATNLIIDGNRIEGPGQVGIQLLAARSGGPTTGNIGANFDVFRPDNIYVNISNNYLDGTDTCTGQGIDCSVVQKFNITSNQIKRFSNSSRGGITLQSSAIEGVISGNFIDSCYYGVFYNGCTGVVTMNNMVVRCKQQGIYLNVGEHLSCSYNQVFNNSQAATPTPNQYGIVINPGVNYLHLNNNQVYDNQAGSVTGVSVANVGADFSDGAKTFIEMTGGTGKGLYLSFMTSSATITNTIAIERGGTGYSVGQLVSLTNAGESGLGTGASLAITAVGSATQSGIRYAAPGGLYIIANGNICYPNAGDGLSGFTNLQYMDIAGVIPNIEASSITQNLYGQLPGTNRTDDAGGGNVGENMFASVTFANASLTPLTTNTVSNVASCSLNLTAGDWDVWSNAYFTGDSSTTISYITAGLSESSGTILFNPSQFAIQSYSGGAGTPFSSFSITGLGIGPYRFKYAGFIQGATVTNPGAGYTGASTSISISLTGASLGAHGFLTPIVNNGTLSTVVITNPGQSYIATDTPVVLGDGTGATVSVGVFAPPKTMYLVAKSVFTGGSLAVYGGIRARRRR